MSKKAILKLRWHIRTTINRIPWLYLPLVRMKRDLFERPVGKGTEVVIEGFPRSANTFSVVAFEYAQVKPVNTAHHLHAPSQVFEAVRRNIPVMVLVRDPEGCILSFRAFAPHISTKQALKEYIRFYKSIIPHRQHYVVAEFKAVVKNFGASIRSLNQKFGSDFAEFQHTEENVKHCYELIDKMQGEKSDKSSEAFVQRPSEKRKKSREALKELFWAPDLEGIRQEAYRLYEMFASYAEADE